MSARHDDFRDYRRKGIPMADEPRGCDDLTPAVLCVLAGAVAFVAFVAVAWGFA